MVSVVVPIYNEEELIVQFHEAVAGALQRVIDDWEVVYVNDGSTDSSLELLKGLQTLDSHVVVVELSRNWGHMGAISAGLHTASGTCGDSDGRRFPGSAGCFAATDRCMAERR